MNQELLKNNYIKIPKFISESRAKILRTNFTEYVKKNNLKGDGQAPNSYSSYNYREFLELLCENQIFYYQ